MINNENKPWEEIKGSHWYIPQMRQVRNDHNNKIIDNVVMRFDKPETAIAFSRWLRWCDETNPNITVRDSVKPDNIVLVWHGSNLSNIEFMTMEDAQKYINEKTKLVQINK